LGVSNVIRGAKCRFRYSLQLSMGGNSRYNTFVLFSHRWVSSLGIVFRHARCRYMVTWLVGHCW